MEYSYAGTNCGVTKNILCETSKELISSNVYFAPTMMWPVKKVGEAKFAKINNNWKSAPLPYLFTLNSPSYY
jgi:hypothetical protein